MLEINEPNSEILLARAQAAEQKLDLIYSSKLWKFSSKIRKLFPNFFHISKYEKKHLHSSVVNTSVYESINSNIKTVQSSTFDLSKGSIVIAHWSNENTFDETFVFLIDQMKKTGLNIVIVSANPDLNPDIVKLHASEVTILTKPNIGYDFGSWLAALTSLPQLLDSTELILMNDSCFGPFGDVNKLIEETRKSPFDITSITDSGRFGYHLQSYFLHFKKSATESEFVKKFLLELPALENKSELVLRYEIGFTNYMQANGLLCGALIPWNTVSLPWINPSTGNAKSLLAKGSPFIKKEFLRKASKNEIAEIESSLAIHGEYTQSFKKLIQELI